jgi:hypothetical protein
VRCNELPVELRVTNLILALMTFRKMRDFFWRFKRAEASVVNATVRREVAKRKCNGLEWLTPKPEIRLEYPFGNTQM